MLLKQTNQNLIIVSGLRGFGLLFLLLGAFIVNVQAQVDAKKAHLPVLQDYRGIKIGMAASDVRAKLGKAQSDDKDGFLYVFSDDESAQILVDGEQKVRTISVMFGGDNPKPIKCEDIFGKNVEAEKQANGALYKLVKYTEAGYWVSYSRMAGDKPSVMMVMQKF